MKGSDANGFYNAEYAIPEQLVTDASGEVKKQFVVRLTASATTLCPGLYYVRLMKGYNPNLNAYRFVASEWTTGDSNRVSASNITYDNTRNVIHVNATGNNNVALMLKYQEHDYTIGSDQIYLVVRGTNLSTAAGASYLWWLNGSNHGTQVAPTRVETVTLDNEEHTIIAWDMTKSGIYENFSGDRPSVCEGMTIFGLTSTTGQSDIYDINFVPNIDDYVKGTTGISSHISPTGSRQEGTYQLNGMKSDNHHGIVVTRGGKYISSTKR